MKLSVNQPRIFYVIIKPLEELPGKSLGVNEVAEYLKIATKTAVRTISNLEMCYGPEAVGGAGRGISREYHYLEYPAKGNRRGQAPCHSGQGLRKGEDGRSPGPAEV